VYSAEPSTRRTSDERLELTRTAFADDPRMEVSDMELARSGPSWMVKTLETIQATRKPDPLWLVIGADQYNGFGNWREPERIVELADLAVMPRDGTSPQADPRYPFVGVPVTRVDVSSTRVRERLAEGLGARYLVPESIRERLEEIWSQKPPAVSLTAAGSNDLKRDEKDGC
jgi:nicotinate-nucleotide adenylyltransferase